MLNGARIRNILSLIVNDASKFTDCLEQYNADHQVMAFLTSRLSECVSQESHLCNVAFQQQKLIINICR